MTSKVAAIEPLLTEMYEKQSVLQGWDIVVHLSESAVGDFVLHQWAVRSTQACSVIWCSNASEQGGKCISSVTQLDLTLNAPHVRLQSGQDAATICLGISAAELKTGILQVDDAFKPDDCACKLNDPRVIWDCAKSFDPAENAYIECNVPLSVALSYALSNTHSVSLDLSAGSLSLHNLGLDGVDASAMFDKLQRWLVENIGQFEVASIEHGSMAEWLGSNPATPEINVMQTEAGIRILQLFIRAQNNKQSQSPRVEIKEPIPVANDGAFSVMFSSRILFQDIVQRFNDGAGLLKLVVVAPDSSSGSYHAQVRNPMAYEGTVDFRGFYPKIKNHADLGMNFSGSPTTGLAISHYTSPGANIDLQLDVSGNYPIKITGSGKNQSIGISAGAAVVTATGMAESTVKPQLEDFLDGVKNDMNAICLQGFSQFVLKNMNFPGHMAEMHRAETPGDFVVFGAFQKNMHETSGK